MLIPYAAPAELYRQDMEIKKSIFITHILPVNSEEDAQQALADFRKKYKDATHNCYAWRIGTERIPGFRVQGSAGSIGRAGVVRRISSS